jgi:hypothetical protein
MRRSEGRCERGHRPVIHAARALGAGVPRARFYPRCVTRFLLAHATRISVCGLLLLVAGIVVTLVADLVVGLALIGGAALLLAISQPLLMQWVRSRAGRRVATRNGHPGPALPEDVDPYLKR